MSQTEAVSHAVVVSSVWAEAIPVVPPLQEAQWTLSCYRARGVWTKEVLPTPHLAQNCPFIWGITHESPAQAPAQSCSKAPVNADGRTDTQGEVQATRRSQEHRSQPGTPRGGRLGPSGLLVTRAHVLHKAAGLPRGRRPGLAPPAASFSWAPWGGDQMLIGVPVSAGAGCQGCPHTLSRSVSWRELSPFLAHASEWYLLFQSGLGT